MTHIELHSSTELYPYYTRVLSDFKSLFVFFPIFSCYALVFHALTRDHIVPSRSTALPGTLRVCSRAAEHSISGGPALPFCEKCTK